MLGDLALVGGVMGFVVGLLEISHRLQETAPRPLSTAAAIREAMRGTEANAVRAEYRRSGIEPARQRPRPLGFGV